MDAAVAANRGYSGLHRWMAAAEKIWTKNSESQDMTLTDRWNYHNELSAQFPLAPLRVVYAKAGTLPAACLIRDESVIDHKLYWCAFSNENEARFLEAILNSEAARSRVAGFQSRGQWGARDFDKVVFNLPIPRFEEKNKLHRELAEAAQKAERAAASVALPENVKFQRARKLIREALTEAKLAQQIDELVARLLDAPLRES